MSLQYQMQQLGIQARASARHLARARTADKNTALHHLAHTLSAQQAHILTANAEDIRNAEAQGLAPAMIDRLKLTTERFRHMLDGIHQVKELTDPIGEILNLKYRPSGIQVGQMRVPLGVVGIIYESRPNVTIEAASLCLKSGNACILRGGSESIATNRALAQAITAALNACTLPQHCVQILDTTDRAAVGLLVSMPDYVDVIVPRGGKGLIAHISSLSKVPVIKHLDGICHVYIHKNADIDMACKIVLNAKTQRYGVCNAMETLLIDQDIAADALNRLVPQLQERGVELRGCRITRSLNSAIVIEATEADWCTEYLAPILSIRVVADCDAAMNHIRTYGSHHTDAIVTQDYATSRRFIHEVDSSSVMVNVSTRFADGFEYGLGAEIGISTDKFHARGPVGLEGLSSLKWIVLGEGQVRGE